MDDVIIGLFIGRVWCRWDILSRGGLRDCASDRRVGAFIARGASLEPGSVMLWYQFVII